MITPSTGSLQSQGRFGSSPIDRTLALVLAGGRGSRLHALTDWRAKPAVPFGGKYRLIDFALSNCLNSGISRVGVLTQYMSHSLNKHVQQGWRLNASNGDPMIELLPAQQRTSEHCWYSGTADAVYQNLDIIRTHAPEYVLVLAGDHVYKMDYRDMLETHIASGAQLTIAASEVGCAEATELGVLSINESDHIVGFEEKPAVPQTLPDKPDRCSASMGIYIFNSDLLYDVLQSDHGEEITQHDFGRNIIPSLIDNNHRVVAHRFCNRVTEEPEYWRDVGTLDAFWRANLELIGVLPQLNLYDQDWPIRTRNTQAPPAKFIFDSAERCGQALNSMICEGCIISGARITNSLLSTNVIVNEKSDVDECVILPDSTIGEGSRLLRVILDRHCTVPPGTVIGYSKTDDNKHFHVTDEGITLVTHDMLAKAYPDLSDNVDQHRDGPKWNDPHGKLAA